ncbi:hypothetical protein CF392_08130 [Tamilnaduibacter salinus]|uniref:Uncharacterized protein n=1 Tax=Tamilnaduibacter salinus TaxID=1484056 RepID=A0A2A2I4I5_9GAMM|nr:hypothetical protein [Tamilnaduibacter salinus]PAV25933.1 hypothetical protein CF392_08130 [Tamilnaduibacter salinus]
MSTVERSGCAPSANIWLELIGQQSMANHQYLVVKHAEEGDSETPMAECPDHQGRRGPILQASAEETQKRSLILRLEGDEAIDLPLMEQNDLGPHDLRPPQREHQDNLMVAVHPTLFCDAGELTHPRPLTGYEEAIPAPIRTGWVYVFFGDRLWREVAVMADPEQPPVFRDTAIESARTASEPIHERPAVGPELDVLHLPARMKGADVSGDIQLAFSETQWSWDYIEALEGDRELRSDRCRDARALKAFIERQADELYNDWTYIDHMRSLRGRDHPVERDVTCPGHWLRDVDGSRTQGDKEELVEQRDAIEADEDVVEASYYVGTPTLYPRWRQAHLNGEALPEMGAGVDVLAPLRDRHILTLHLRDPLYAARHLVGQINASMALLLDLVDHVKKRPFGVTAELFHNNFRRQTLPDGSTNPLFIEDGWLDNRLDESDSGRLLRTVYDAERRAIRAFVRDAQMALVRLLNDGQPGNLAAVLRDLFALESGNSVAGYFQSGPMLQVLSLPANRVDPLILPQEFDADSGDEAASLALAIARGEHLLGKLLLPFQENVAECRAGDATVASLKAMADGLNDQQKELRVLEANVVRELAAHQDDTQAPDAAAITGVARIGSHAFQSIAGELGQWWLSTVQKELQQKGATFTAEVSRIKGAFEGFAEAAIPGRTQVQIEGSDDGRAFVVLDVVDESGQTLTSGAAVGASLRLAEAGALDGTVKHQSVKHWLHQSTTSPIGLPGILVVFDLWNVVNTTFYTSFSARQSAGVISALVDLGVSSSQVVALLPNQPERLASQVSRWKQEAQWFTRLAEQFGSNDRYAKAVVRNHLEAGGWVAGMFTAALIASDAATSFANRRWGTGSTQLIQAGGIATMTNADLIAARILTPAGRRAVERSSVQAAQATLGRLIPAAARWTGTVASGYVTALGFAIYVLGEAAYYRLKDDAVSQWLRAGPFSGDREEQTDALRNEATAYLELVKAMTPIALKRIDDEPLSQWLQARNLGVWDGEAESVLTFASPALAITGEPAAIDLEIAYEQVHDRILGPNPAGGWRTNTLATRSGRIGRAIEERYDPQRQAIDFMIGKAQLPDLTPLDRHERVTTRYTVKRLSLTFTVDVWQRETQDYKTQTITHTMEDLDVQWRG